MTKQTKAEIENAFIELLNTRPLSEISVNEIAQACGLNRNTFYYHYRSIADLIDSTVRGLVAQILAEHPPAFDALEDCFMAAIRLASTNKTAILHIYHSTSRAIFERHLWKFCDYAVESYLNSLPSELSPLSSFEAAGTLPSGSSSSSFESAGTPPSELSPLSSEPAAARQIASEMLRFELFGFTMDWISRQMPEDVAPKVKLLADLLRRQFKA